MADPILMFPRVVLRYADPTSADDKTLGYIDGNIWVNKTTGTIFFCVDAETGSWVTLLASGSAAGGGNLSFGDGVDSNVNFDLGAGNFTVDAANIDITGDGTLHLKGGQIEFYYERTGEPLSGDYAIVKVERGDQKDAFIKWSEEQDAWLAGIDGPGVDKLFPISTVVTLPRNPEPEDYEGHYIGQTWVNTVTQQKFTCMSRDTVAETCSWRLALTTAPTKYMVEYDDFLILYGASDDTFMKISVNDFASWIEDVVGGIGTSTSGYAWVLDASDNITFSDEDPITEGLFEEDGNGDMQPVSGSDVDVFFELDANDNVMPRAA